MPYFVVEKDRRRRSTITGQSLKGSRILVLGLAYKRDIDDLRESPSLTIIELLREKGAIVLQRPLLPHRRPRPPLRPQHDLHSAGR
jgi:UDP-N-acetyl-D-mannosaminuronate dehydrogenase